MRADHGRPVCAAAETNAIAEHSAEIAEPHETSTPLIFVPLERHAAHVLEDVPFATLSNRQSTTRTFSIGALANPWMYSPYGLFWLVTRSISMSRATGVNDPLSPSS